MNIHFIKIIRFYISYIFILKTNSIEAECTSILTKTYCITNLNAIRWYESPSRWIEYNKADFENGNVTISTAVLLVNLKLNNLKVGANIFVKDGNKYLKLANDIVRID